MQRRTRIIAFLILDLKMLREGKEAVLKKLKNLRFFNFFSYLFKFDVGCSYLAGQPQFCYEATFT
ncbi:hypothetical protein BPAE_0370g00060 [Botrytis paeoniae]|uniref:Uncharacterized protein n=1 Tax=Botrytis paeoniae TaxID=278948 RepID=A0A4Z1F4L0_9HELO|nr:hypothetical protein BPAE_0370g00060 [Botrytis paeoniae]